MLESTKPSSFKLPRRRARMYRIELQVTSAKTTLAAVFSRVVLTQKNASSQSVFNVPFHVVHLLVLCFREADRNKAKHPLINAMGERDNTRIQVERESLISICLNTSSDELQLIWIKHSAIQSGGMRKKSYNSIIHCTMTSFFLAGVGPVVLPHYSTMFLRYYCIFCHIAFT